MMDFPELEKEGIIGIAGGMGPLAGLDLATKVVNNTIAGKDQEHIPFILASLAELTEDRTEWLEGRVEVNPAYNIARILANLDRQGCSLAAMACNTAHSPRIFDVILSELEKVGAKIRLLHIVDETAKLIREYYPDVDKVGILGTTGTFNAGLYEGISRHGLETVNVSRAEQDVVHSAIYDPEYGIKSTPRRISKKSIDDLHSAAESLISKGAGAIILGCTEIPLAFTERTFMNIPVIDATEALARALVREHSPEKLKKWGE